MKRQNIRLRIGILMMISMILFGACGQSLPSIEQTASHEAETGKETAETTETESVTETETVVETEVAETEAETEVTESVAETEATESVAETEVIESEVLEIESTQDDKEPNEDEIKRVSEEIGLQVDQVELDLPDVQNTYELLFVSDMHVVNLDESVLEQYKETIETRRDVMFRTRTGMASAEAWPKLASVLDDFSADGIIFGGDMIDFASPANMQVLSQGLSQVTTPYIYLRADHDLEAWFSGGAIGMGDSLDMHASISSYQDMFVMEYPEFYILGWNNSTGQLTNHGLNTALKIWDSGKPIILATHVPINSIVDSSLEEVSANVDPENRKKVWGNGCLYRPKGNTEAFLDMLYDENSPVKAVLSGHLHFRHVVQLTEQTVEYVFAPAFEGDIAKIVIK